MSTAASPYLGNDSAAITAEALTPGGVPASPDTSNLPVSTGTSPGGNPTVTPPTDNSYGNIQASPPPQQGGKGKGSLMSDILHAIGEVLGGPSSIKQVDPTTGKLIDHPLTRAERIGNTASIYLRGAAAGAAQHGPAAAGKAALAGATEQQQFGQQQRENTLAESRNVRETNAAEQEKQMSAARLSLMSQQSARMGLDYKAAKLEFDQNQLGVINALQKNLNRPGVKLLQHFDSNDEINDHLETVGPMLAKQRAIDLASNDIQLFVNPKGGFDALEIPKGAGDKAIGPGMKVHRAVMDPKTNTLKLTAEDADPNMTWDQYNNYENAAMGSYNGSQEVKQKLDTGLADIALKKSQQKEAEAQVQHINAETNLTNEQAKALINSQQADPFGFVSPLPTKEALKRSDEFQKDVVNKAYDTEKAYNMSQQAYAEYQAAAKQGKELPTGAQSMLLLSQHLQSTFGQTKGARITKDMIATHLGARGITDDAVTAVQRIVNGDQLSPAQWKAFTDLIGQSRNEIWENAIGNAKNQQIPVTFLPRGNGRAVIDANTAQLYLDAAGGDWQKATAAAQKQGWQVQ